MAAVTRWTEYLTSATGYMADSYQAGTRAYKDGTLISGSADKFTITSANDKLNMTIDGDAFEVTLASGSELDPRFIAKDITEKIHAYSVDEKYQTAQCEWRVLTAKNSHGFRIWGSIGSGKAVSVNATANSAHTTLGFVVGGGTSGSNNNFIGYGYEPGSSYDTLTSGTWEGFWDETYYIMMVDGTNDPNLTAATTHGIKTVTPDGSNSYAGTMTVGGFYADDLDTSETYVIEIDTTNGTTVGAGAGNVPRYKISTHATDSNPSDWTDILYPDFWYPVGNQGVKVKWTDAVFNSVNPAWTIDVESPTYIGGTDNKRFPGGGTPAKYIWMSNRGDDWKLTDGVAPIETVSGSYTRVGTRGLNITFSGTGQMRAREVYEVMCRPPQPDNYGITQLNYGNVTVSTESPVKAVAFEIMSGAYELSSIKFGLQSHGTFSYHDGANTKFRFGTVGPGNNAGSGDLDGLEWRTDVIAGDIDDDTPPAFLFATEDDLAEVASADLSEDIGNTQIYLQSDPIWLCILLGANETGANSTINYRLYFDYS